MRILLTNDDGIDAPGLAAFRQALGRLGEVIVVAPDSEQSAVGHAITLHKPLRVVRTGSPGGNLHYAVTGTPADCVKIALSELLDHQPDLVASGVNLGPNTGVSVFYSGTVSGAFEGAIMGIPSLAVSLNTFRDPPFDPAADVGARIAEKILRDGLPSGVFLNVNVPALPRAEWSGVRAVRQGLSRFVETYHRRHDPRGREYYWLDGYMERIDTDEDTDVAALEAGHVAVTALRADLTDPDATRSLADWPWDSLAGGPGASPS